MTPDERAELIALWAEIFEAVLRDETVPDETVPDASRSRPDAVCSPSDPGVAP